MALDSSWKFYVIRRPEKIESTEFYLIRYSLKNGSPQYFYANFDGEGNLRMTEYDENAEPKPLLRIGRFFDPEGLMLAIADGLKKAGIEIEVDVSKRVAAQALADEREKELDYFKKLNAKFIESRI